MVLVDTSIWSQALRRGAKHNKDARQKLSDLIVGNRAEIIGPIRQELLSGIREKAQFETLQEHLAAFPDIAIQPEDYITAARFFNLCRSKGIQGSNTDYLICAIAVHHQLEIFTSDNDFKNYEKVLPIKLYK